MRYKVDICLRSEMKLDGTFSNQQFKIHGCKMYCRGRNKMAEEFFFMLMKIFFVKL